MNRLKSLKLIRAKPKKKVCFEIIIKFKLVGNIIKRFAFTLATFGTTLQKNNKQKYTFQSNQNALVSCVIDNNTILEKIYQVVCPFFSTILFNLYRSISERPILTQ